MGKRASFLQLLIWTSLICLFIPNVLYSSFAYRNLPSLQLGTSILCAVLFFGNSESESEKQTNLLSLSWKPKVIMRRENIFCWYPQLKNFKPMLKNFDAQLQSLRLLFFKAEKRCKRIKWGRKKKKLFWKKYPCRFGLALLISSECQLSVALFVLDASFYAIMVKTDKINSDIINKFRQCEPFCCCYW